MDTKILVGDKVFELRLTAVLAINRVLYHGDIAETQYCAEIEKYERTRRTYIC